MVLVGLLRLFILIGINNLPVPTELNSMGRETLCQNLLDQAFQVGE